MNDENENIENKNVFFSFFFRNAPFKDIQKTTENTTNHEYAYTSWIILNKIEYSQI